MAMNWLKRLVAGKELETLARYRAAVEAYKASSSHDSAVTAWSIYHEAEDTGQHEYEAEIDRRNHPFN